MVPGSAEEWDKSAIAPNSILNYEGKYHMWYMGSIYTETNNVGYAESDGPAWKQMKSMDIARGGSVSCVIDSMIFVSGGTSSSLVTLSKAGAQHISSNDWAALKNIPVNLYESNAEVINGKIYVTGGWRSGNPWFTTDKTFEYDPVNNSWETKKECPKKSGENISCVFHDKLYFFGGAKEFPDIDPSGQKDALVYDPSSDTWRIMKGMPL